MPPLVKENDEVDFEPGVSAGSFAPLPKRFSIYAMSVNVGWRLTGVQSGQVKVFFQRFPIYFSLQALGKLVLPHKGGKPYLTQDGKLPCPFLSTFNAIKMLVKDGFEDLEKQCSDGTADPIAVEDMKRLVERGTQAEWKEFPSYTAYMLSMEGASWQADVSLKPHLADTAMLYVQFCMSEEGSALLAKKSPPGCDAGVPGASQDTVSVADNLQQALRGSSKDVDEAFLQHMQGSSKHRFADAMRFLRRTDVIALVRLVSWRKKAHYLHANSMAQCYFTSGEWGALYGKELSFETPTSAQLIVLNQVLKKVGMAQIVQKDTPKLVRPEMNMDLWSSMCKVLLPAEDYFRALATKFSAVAHQVPSVAKLRRRLVFAGEDGLRDIFNCGLARQNGPAAEIRFKGDDERCEFALVELKLDEALESLVKASPVNQSKITEDAKAPDAPGTVAGASANPPGDSAGRTGEGEGKAPDESEKQEPAEGDGAEAKPEAPKKRAGKQENAVTRVRMDDVLVVVEAPPKIRMTPSLPDVIGLLPAGTMFVVPAPSWSRGNLARAVNPHCKSLRNYVSLGWMTEEHCLLLGLGHDPSSFTRVKAMLEGAFPIVQECQWKPAIGTMPVLQTYKRMKPGCGYVEHLTLGVGKKCPPVSLMGWVSDVQAYPIASVRVVSKCDHDLATGPCPTSTWATKRFVTPFPAVRVAKKRKPRKTI